MIRVEMKKREKKEQWTKNSTRMHGKPAAQNNFWNRFKKKRYKKAAG